MHSPKMTCSEPWGTRVTVPPASCWARLMAHGTPVSHAAEAVGMEGFANKTAFKVNFFEFFYMTFHVAKEKRDKRKPRKFLVWVWARRVWALVSLFFSFPSCSPATGTSPAGPAPPSTPSQPHGVSVPREAGEPAVRRPRAEHAAAGAVLSRCRPRRHSAGV